MPRVSQSTWERLAETALTTRLAAYAPYSKFKVGAALLTQDGTIFSGCNVENASYGLCICAERNAITSAVAAGHKRFHALAIATSGASPAPPCGMCAQFLSEFCVELEVLLVTTQGVREKYKLSRLMPHPFRWKGAGTKHSPG